jgi:trehalose-6-phosphatase
MTSSQTADKMTTFYISKKDFPAWLKTQNKNKTYAEDIKRHLDTDSIKAATGLKTMVGVSNILVDEDGTAKGLCLNRTMSYNDSYCAMWGDVPLRGNAVVVVSDKVWASLPAEKKVGLNDVKF